MSDTKYYSTKDLMEQLRISRFAIYRANQSGALPIAKKEGTVNYYSEADVKNYIRQSGAAKIVSK